MTMYRLINYKSSQSVRLLISRQKCIENINQSFHSLLNREKHILKLSGKYCLTVFCAVLY